MIIIIDSGIANLHSVQKGFEKAGHQAKITENPRDLDGASAIVLPGVGAFADGIHKLEQRGFVEPLRRNIEKGKPLLGICLGLHFLFSESEEFGLHKGLGIFPGRVRRFSQGQKVPHMGWNTLQFKRQPPIFEGIAEGSYFYFVHSYYVDPEDKTIIASVTDYGLPFASMVWKDNIVATQFHPEKSQALGLRVLKNFGDWAKTA